VCRPILRHVGGVRTDSPGRRRPNDRLVGMHDAGGDDPTRPIASRARGKKLARAAGCLIYSLTHAAFEPFNLRDDLPPYAAHSGEPDRKFFPMGELFCAKESPGQSALTPAHAPHLPVRRNYFAWTPPYGCSVSGTREEKFSGARTILRLRQRALAFPVNRACTRSRLFAAGEAEEISYGQGFARASVG
jgi:hypothetical protein